MPGLARSSSQPWPSLAKAAFVVQPTTKARRLPVECPVCLEVMFEAAAHLTTTCGHTFHRRCLAPSVSRCPMCRSDLTAEDAHKLGRSLQWST